MNYKRYSIVFVFSFIVLPCTVFSDELETDCKSVIAQYEKSIQAVRSLQYSYNAPREQNASYVYSGKKVHSFYQIPVSDSKVLSTKELLFSDNQFIIITNNKDNEDIGKYSISIIEQDIFFDKKEISPFIKHHCLLGFVHGTPQKIGYIPKLLREYIISAKSETIDRLPLIHLQGAKDGLEVSAWLAPSQNYALHRIKYQLDEKNSQGGDIVFFDYKPKNFQQYGDVWLPSEYNYDYAVLTMNYKYDEKMNLIPGVITRNSASYSVQLKGLKVNLDIPEDVFSVKTEIPNGTKVIMQSIPHIEHIWFDGKIEPKTGELMLRIARGGHRFMPGTNEPRGFG